MTRTVFGRALTLLAAFRGAPDGELTLTELSAASGLPLTTTHRLCGQLEHEGALERRPDGRYQVGLKLWEMAVYHRPRPKQTPGRKGRGE